MPLYEYRCTACGHQIELLQKVADPPLTTCERCQGSLVKLLSPSAIQFKGTGWYVTDYAKKGKTGDESKTEKVEGKSEGKPQESKDAKPTQPDAKPAAPPSASVDKPDAPRKE